MHNISELIAHLEEIQSGKRRVYHKGVNAIRIIQPNDPRVNGYLNTFTSSLHFEGSNVWMNYKHERFDIPYGHAVVIQAMLNDGLIGPAIDYLSDVVNGVPV